MKRKRIDHSPCLGASIGMLLLLAWGCGQEPADSLPASGDPSVPVNITTSIDADILYTRGTVNNGSIGVFLRAVDGVYKAQYNVKYTNNNNTGWKASVPVYVGTNDASLFAYYPYKENLFTEANPTKCTLKANVNTTANELFYARDSYYTVNSNTPNATFSMSRAYASLKLSIQRDPLYGGTCNITDVNLKSLKSGSSGSVFYDTRTLDINNGTLSDGTQPSGGWTYPLNTGPIGSTENTKYNVLVPPQDLAATGLTITLTVDNADQTVTIPANRFTTSPKLAPGWQYTIKLTITGIEVIVGGPIEYEWIEYDQGDNIENNGPIIVYP